MQKQFSLFQNDHGALAGLVPSLRAAMNRAAGADVAARKLQAWFLSKAGQQAIADFKLEGKQLFTPNATK